MLGMFWIALELSIPKIGFNIMLSLTVKKLDAFKFDGVAESDNTVGEIGSNHSCHGNQAPVDTTKRKLQVCNRADVLGPIENTNLDFLSKNRLQSFEELWAVELFVYYSIHRRVYDSFWSSPWCQNLVEWRHLATERQLLF